MILNRLSINTTDPRVFDLLNEMRKNRILYSIWKTGSEPVDVLHRTDTITVYCTDETNIRQVVYNLNRAVGRGDITVELVPENVVVNFDRSLSVSKGDEDRTYEGFDIVVDNNIYELLEIANKILDDEAKYGNTETTFLMDRYHDVKVEKDLKTDGSAIYTLTNRKTGEKFLFASRSLVLPPGYGIIQ